MICDTCYNYQPCMSGVNAYYFTACKSLLLYSYEKKKVLEGGCKSCPDYIKNKEKNS